MQTKNKNNRQTQSNNCLDLGDFFIVKIYYASITLLLRVRDVHLLVAELRFLLPNKFSAVSYSREFPLLSRPQTTQQEASTLLATDVSRTRKYKGSNACVATMHI